MTPSDNPNRRKAELEDSLDRYGKSSRIFGLLVVIGLIIEFVAIVLSFSYEAVSRLVDAIGLFLVTLGVAGEIRAEFDSHRAERRLRLVNEELSEIAEAQIKERDERIADLGLKIEQEQNRTADLNLKIEEEKLARVKIEGENALREIEILKLRRALADRTLTPEEFNAISAEMLPFPGQVFRVTTDSSQKTEQSGFARSIMLALVNAKWSVENIFIDSRTLRPLVGMAIQATDDITSQNAAKALAVTLHRLGHVVEFDSSRPDSWLWFSSSNPNPFGAQQRIWVRIGEKPNPPVAD